MNTTKRSKRNERERASPRTERAEAAEPAAGFSSSIGTGPVHQTNVRDFIRAMCVELSLLAYRNRLDPLAVVFDMAREVADTESTKATDDARKLVERLRRG